jgi:Ca2+-binding RTX toxin-like protein
VTLHRMRRSGGLVGSCALTLVVAGAMLLGRPDAAVAVGETCHGFAATVVGTPGAELQGTAGPDVVVTNGATALDAGGGDDLVCVTGAEGLDAADVEAGDGNDIVDASTSGAERTGVVLGAGDDVYLGSPKVDFVRASEPYSSPFDPPPDQGADTVSTGDGDDLVQTGGSAAHPDHDTIDLGGGNDDAWLQGVVDPTRPIVGGTGSDLVEFDRSTLREALVIDNAVGQATAAGVPVIAWSAMERFRLSPIGPYEPPSFVGGPGPERVEAYVPLTSVDLGGGDDLLNLELQHRLVNHASYDGGAGDDSFVIYSGAGDKARRARLDLPRSRLLFQRERQTVRARISGFERHKLSADDVVVRGSAGADHVQWAGCHGVVNGGPGDDVVEEFSPADTGCGYPINDPGQYDVVVQGGRGDDRLVGGRGPDTLLGGPGKDLADGRGSKGDRCVAERELGCEL